MRQPVAAIVSRFSDRAAPDDECAGLFAPAVPAPLDIAPVSALPGTVAATPNAG